MNSVPKFVRNDERVHQHDVSRYLQLADTLLEAPDQQENTG